MTKMPVYSGLLNGIPVMEIDCQTGGLVQTDADIGKYLVAALTSAETAIFNVQVASEIYWSGNKNVFDIQTDYAGTVKLPFPITWMEWKKPRIVKRNGKLVDDEIEIHQAAIMTELKGNDPLIFSKFKNFNLPVDADNHIFFELYLHVPHPDGHLIAIYPTCAILSINAAGSVIKETPVYRRGGDTVYASRWYEDMGDLDVAMHALALINCRNVSVEDGGRVIYRRTSSEKRRRNAPDIRFKTIILPGTKSSREGSQTGRHNDDMALHRVRGHFKTFTADRPLLGQHVGTYWWGWQIRGKAENGINVSDYRLAE